MIHIIGKALLLTAVTSFLFSTVYAQQILVGWHSFDGLVSSSAADESIPGVAGTIEGGFEETVGRNINNNTYGNSHLSITPGATDRGVLLNTFSNPNARLIIKITNNSGSDITIDSILFDVQLVFSSKQGNTSDQIRVAHLSGSSDLRDTFSGRDLTSSATTGILYIPEGDFTVYQFNIVTAHMADNTLSNGETAAFRIEAVDSNGLAGPGFGLKLDNIGVVSVSVPKTGKE